MTKYWALQAHTTTSFSKRKHFPLLLLFNWWENIPPKVPSSSLSATPQGGQKKRGGVWIAIFAWTNQYFIKDVWHKQIQALLLNKYISKFREAGSGYYKWTKLTASFFICREVLLYNRNVNKLAVMSSKSRLHFKIPAWHWLNPTWSLAFSFIIIKMKKLDSCLFCDLFYDSVALCFIHLVALSIPYMTQFESLV